MDNFFQHFDIANGTLRFAIFLVGICLFSVAEAVWPKRPRIAPRMSRWITNGGMLVLATLLVRLLTIGVPLLAGVATASWAANQGFGVFNTAADLPFWLEFILAIILLDLAIWFQHVLSHRVPLLWRLHRVHHVDRDIDASTALRFHPVEIVLSAAYKIGIIALLGPAMAAVIVFEILLNFCAMFNHANWALPRWIDRALRCVLVTPDMHRVHHSVIAREHNTNFGFWLSVWDRMFGTYTDQPSHGHSAMTIGLEDYQTGDPQRLGWSIFFPLK